MPAQRRARLSTQDRFIDWFQSVAPYIHAFRGKTFVIAFGGEVVADGRFFDLTHDLNLLAALGVRLVLVHGARPQIEEQLKERKQKTRFNAGLRVTDEAALVAAKEASGRLRVEIEALLSMGLRNSPMAGADIRVASGNFIIAKPLGVLDGIDYMHTGEVRKVDATAMQRRLNDNDLVLVSPLGYSPTGEVFNLALEDVAAATAIALQAEKLIFLMDSVGVKGRRGELLRELTVREAQTRIARVRCRSATCVSICRRPCAPASRASSACISSRAISTTVCCSNSSRTRASARCSRPIRSRRCARRASPTSAASCNSSSRWKRKAFWSSATGGCSNAK